MDGDDDGTQTPWGRCTRSVGVRTSTWVANAPFDSTVEWDADLTEDTADERIELVLST